LEKIVDLAKNYQLDWANYNIKELNKMGIQRTNGDEASEDTNLIPQLTVKLTLQQWMWMHKLIGETQGILECAVIQFKGTNPEHHMIHPFDSLVEQWEVFLETVSENEKKCGESRS
ncbi:MAG TPA: hypothetical protein PKC44_08990, partial [Agitococcus sp.]|nr:hypothetical protein [Agitococcus sp.]